MYSSVCGISLNKYLRPEKRSRTLRRILVAFVILFVISLVLGSTASTIGAVSEIGTGRQILTTGTELSVIPKSVIEDAHKYSATLLGEHDPGFLNELLALFTQTRDKDLVILFNPGGWGDSTIEQAYGWQSIIKGIQSELNTCQVDSLVLTYQRTVDSIQGHLGELIEMARGYPGKARDLAYRIQFLTSLNPDLKVVIAAESMGSLISEKAMGILSPNSQVFSIQTGTPPVHPSISTEQTLVINNNGVVPDAFSQGNVLTIIRANLVRMFNLSQPESGQGKILKNIYAPGHDYSWIYNAVSSQITQFLNETIGIGESVPSNSGFTIEDQRICQE